MNKKQREERKKSVKAFMAEKREYNKSHPDEHEIKKLKHKGEHVARLTTREKRELRKWKKKKIRQLKNDFRDKLINETEYSQRMKKLKDKKNGGK